MKKMRISNIYHCYDGHEQIHFGTRIERQIW
jgi:hypothetical protein